jgi:hypothetical protein
VQSTTETTGSLELGGITREDFEDAKEDILKAIRQKFYDDYGKWPLSIELSSSDQPTRRQLGGGFVLMYTVLMPSQTTKPSTMVPLAYNQTNGSSTATGVSQMPVVIVLSPEVVHMMVTSAMKTAVATSMNVSTDSISFTTIGNLTSSDKESVAGQCTAGRYSGGAGECLRCSPGKFSDGGASECDMCPVGYYYFQAEEGSTDGNAENQCQRCPWGKYQNANGKVYCEEVWSNHLLVMTPTKGYEQRQCPRIGVSCENNTKRYSGTHWHDPLVVNPNCTATSSSYEDAKCTKMYACINQGCPDAGASKMQCKPGFHGPICAICKEKHYEQLGNCVECSEPRFAAIALFLLVGLIALAALRFLWKYRKVVVAMQVGANLKIIVSFITVVSTVNTQFGIPWPAEFRAMLALLDTLSFDIKVMSSLFCLVSIDFYAGLLGATLGLLAIVLLALVAYVKLPSMRKHVALATVYFCIFAFPVLSVKIMETFACHDVGGGSFLRADYALSCNAAEWKQWVVYSGFWAAVFVVGFPLFLLTSLLLMRADLRNGKADDPAQFMLGFLLYDYKPFSEGNSVACLWESEEIFRKLLLSTIGGFWPDKSPLAIATALLLCASSLILHAHVKPFKSPKSNFLQLFCLSVLTGVYFAGLLLKAQVLAQDSGVGVLLVITLVSMVVAAFALVITEFRTGLRHLRIVLHNFDILYPGNIHPIEGLDCVASFPGKFAEGWAKVVRLGSKQGKVERRTLASPTSGSGLHVESAQCFGVDAVMQSEMASAQLSVACVFFTQHTPKFGKHGINPGTGKCWCHNMYGESKCWGCQWFVEWWENVKEAYYVHKQRIIVYYFPGQVKQGKIKWEDAAAHALLRDRVLGNWPKDEAGWPRVMSKQDEEAYVGRLVAEERHTVSGLGGSQKAEVAWLDYNKIPYTEVDVLDFINEGSAVTQVEPTIKTRQKSTQAVHPMNEDDVMEESVAEKAKNIVENSTDDVVDVFDQSL